MGLKKGDVLRGSCPRCGGALVVRQNKQNGDKFVGCDKFFEGCRYARHIQHDDVVKSASADQASSPASASARPADAPRGAAGGVEDDQRDYGECPPASGSSGPAFGGLTERTTHTIMVNVTISGAPDAVEAVLELGRVSVGVDLDAARSRDMHEDVAAEIVGRMLSDLLATVRRCLDAGRPCRASAPARSTSVPPVPEVDADADENPFSS